MTQGHGGDTIFGARARMDVLWTTATSVAVMIAMLVVNGWLSRRGIVGSFTEVNLGKRAASVLTPIVTLGMSVGSVRLLAAALHAKGREAVRVVTVFLLWAMLLLTAGLMLLFPAQAMSIWGFRDPCMLWATWGYVAAMAHNGIAYCFHRGAMNQGRANVALVMANAVVPLLVVAFVPSSWSGAMVLWAMSAPVILWHMGEFLVLLVGVTDSGVRERLGTSLREVLQWSVPRFPGSFAINAMAAVGPSTAMASGDSTGAAALLAGLVTIQAISAALQSVGTVMLPRASAAVSRGMEAELSRVTGLVLRGSLVLVCLAVPFAWFASGDIVSLWLGASFLSSAPVIRVFALAIPGSLVAVTLRSLVDAGSRFPWNTLASVAGLIIVIVASWVLPKTPVALAAGYAAGPTVMGAFVMASAVVRFRPRLSPTFILSVVALLLVASLALFLNSQLGLSPVTRTLSAATVVSLLLFSTAWKRSPVHMVIWRA